MKRKFFAPGAVLAGLALVFALFSLAGGGAASQATSPGEARVKLDVPYEPSSEDVVAAMLDIAGVGKNDVVYDLGCGDGRILIAAAHKTGARGVGVDLDPQRIQESLENARKAGVTDRLRFFQGDLFKTEIGEATVMMLYLYPEVNLRLRPKLLRELKPSTRVVSHSHNMGEWEADRSVTAPGGHRIHFWVIPANLIGIWKLHLPGENETHELKLDQKFQKVSGVLRFGDEEFALDDVQLKGDRLQFTVPWRSRGKTTKVRFKGLADTHQMTGTALGIGGREERPWQASRNPSSMKPLGGGT